MSTRQNPWDDALAHAERAGADYEVPVTLVRARVRRRRRVRTAARTGTAFAAVGAVAMTLPLVLGGNGGTRPATHEGRPAAFDRCGQPADEPAGDATGPFTVEITEGGGVIGADQTAHTTARVSVDRMTATTVDFAGADVVLLRDGVVVGVAVDAPVTVPLPEAPWPAPARGTVTTEWGFATVLASCGQLPDGDRRIPVGDYELSVTYTFDWSTQDGQHRSTRASRTLPVTVTEDPPPTNEPDPTACLADSALLAALADRKTNPSPVTLDADVPTTTRGDDRIRLTVRATNTGPTAVEGLAERPSVLLTIDGQVLRTPFFWREASTASPTLAPGATVEHDLVVPLTDCTSIGVDDAPHPERGVQVPPGQYELWVVMEMDSTDRTASGGGRERVVGGPWPVEMP